MIAALGTSSAGTEEEKWHVVKGKVLDNDGQPSSGTMVYIVGKDGYGNYLYLEKAQQLKEWQYKTDQNGCFEAKFGEFLSPVDPDPRHKGPGWGPFHFIVLPSANHAGAVSELIYHPRNEEPPREWVGNEWGKPRDIRDSSMEITLVLKNGVTVEGTVVDLTSKTIPGAKVKLWHDLHAWSHTGGGGEILERESTTDEKGVYRFTNVHPVAFSLALSAPDLRMVRTRIGEKGKGVKETISPVTVDKGQDMIRVDFVACRSNRCKIYGTVRDERGKPIAGARVMIVASGCEVKTDDFTLGPLSSNSETKTGQDGSYHLYLSTPWIRYIKISAKGYEFQKMRPKKEFTEPRKYDFRLKKAPRT
jgi:protocatechuate 3,4-dioxygenase beta subunit